MAQCPASIPDLDGDELRCLGQMESPGTVEWLVHVHWSVDFTGRNVTWTAYSIGTYDGQVVRRTDITHHDDVVPLTRLTTEERQWLAEMKTATREKDEDER